MKEPHPAFHHFSFSTVISESVNRQMGERRFVLLRHRQRGAKRYSGVCVGTGWQRGRRSLDVQRVGGGSKSPKLLLGGRQVLNRTLKKFAICCRLLSAPSHYASSTRFGVSQKHKPLSSSLCKCLRGDGGQGQAAQGVTELVAEHQERTGGDFCAGSKIIPTASNICQVPPTEPKHRG